MSQSVHPIQVVLRHVPLHAGAVRVGRPVMAAAPSEGPAAEEPLAPIVSTASPEGHDTGYAEGLRQGTEEGRRTGYEDGLQHGLAEAHARTQALEKAQADATQALQDKLRQVESVLAAIHVQAEAVLSAAHDELVAVCFELVCRVLGPAMLTKQAVQAQVRELVSHPARGTRLALHLHPADLGWVQEESASLGWLDRHHINCVADGQVALGGCVLHSTAGTLDARLETILETCKTSLLAARERQSSATADQVGT